MKLRDSQIIFSALSDETRIRVLNLLGHGELCVCDLMRILDQPQSKISRHLAYLRKAGLVSGRKEGLWMHYRLSTQSVRLYNLLLKAIFSCHRDFDELEDDLKKLKKDKKILVGCCK